MGRYDQYAFGGLRMFAVVWTKTCKLFEEVTQKGDETSGRAIIRIPAVEGKLGEFGFKQTDEGKEAKCV